MAAILVIEDRALDRKYLATVLKTARHTVIEASDGLDGLRLAEQVRPDLVISDILMPTVDGYEFVRRLREHASLRLTPVVFYTATYHEREARKLAEQCGVVDILAKPNSPDTILATVEAALTSTPPMNGELSDRVTFDREHARLVSSTLHETSRVLDELRGRVETLEREIRQTSSRTLDAQEQVLRVLVADELPVVRRGIREVIAESGDMVVADEAVDGPDLLERARRVEHDVVLLDLSMPGSDGLELLKQLRRERPKIPVLIFSRHSEGQFAIRALKAGAAGYLKKDSASAELLGAVRKIVSGGQYLSPLVAEKLAHHLTSDADSAPHAKLSDREYQVLLMIAAGQSTRQIAGELSLSVKTVSSYRARIFEKMQVKSPAEVAAYVVRNRLAD